MKAGLHIIYLAIMLLSVISAILCRKELQQRQVGFIIPYLSYVFIQELCLIILGYLDANVDNAVVYNLYRIFTVIIFAGIYLRVPFLKKFRPLILWTAILFVAVSILDHILLEPITKPSSVLSLVRGFILIFFGIIFLFGYIQIDSKKEELLWRPFLWITIGIVVFYPVISIALYLQSYLLEKSAMLGPFKLYQLIPQLMSIFMYSCFTYAFYLCRTTKEPI